MSPLQGAWREYREAAAAFSRPMAELLMTHGADCRARNRRGAEPLHYAADGGQREPRAQAGVIEYAQQHGVLIVASAGNGGDTSYRYPAAYPGVLAVAGIDEQNILESWSVMPASRVNSITRIPRASALEVSTQAVRSLSSTWV